MYQHDNSWFNSCISLNNLRFYFIFMLCCALLVVLLGFFGILLLSSELFIMAFYTSSSVLCLQRWWSWLSAWRVLSGAYRLFAANFALCLVATFLTWVSHGRAVSLVHAKGASGKWKIYLDDLMAIKSQLRPSRPQRLICCLEFALEIFRFQVKWQS